MPNVIFAKGGNTFTFSRGRVFPVSDPSAVNVPVDYSAGGQLYAYNKGIQERFVNLEYDGLTPTDYDNYDNWLLTVAIGPTNTFTYTDEDGAAHTVRLLDTVNPLSRTRDGGYAGTIKLREEI